MLIDSHCHLDAAAFDVDRQTLYQTCLKAGIRQFIVPSTAPQQWSKTLEVTAAYAGMSCALGCHPWWIEQLDDNALVELERLVAQHQPVAIGEIGLDFAHKPVDKVLQLERFQAQLHLAETYQLPVIIHCCKAYGALLDCLAQYPLSQGGVVHAFSGSLEVAQQLIKQGFYLGIGGLISNPKATRLHHVVQQLPIQSLLLETDSPAMPPVWALGERNTPLNLPRYLHILADIKQMPEAALSTQIMINTQQLFKISF